MAGPGAARKQELTTAFAAVRALVTQFDEHRAAYTAPTYSEAQVRQDFIDKFFTALGWDVTHNVQVNPFEQEVKVERNVSVGGAQRRADYAFHVAPNYRDVRFYAEAKKPHGSIATADNAFQVVRYGWNSQTPISVLLSFEELHIVDCRYRPDIDTAQSCIVRSYSYKDFAKEDKFAEIYFLLSHDAVADGSLEKFATSLPPRRGKVVQRGLFKGGYQSIDDVFLEELDEHRDVLARSLKAKNPELDGDTLTEITQRILDRLVFLRFLEDRLIETKDSVAKLGEKNGVWADFLATSRRLDGIYNGIVFKKHPLIDSGRLQVDENSFGDICEDLSHVNSPYDFNAIPIHILGSIYERFLGKVIVTTEKRARVEEKPEVRKAGGVYYTPDYIVQYIVNNTVGKAIAGKTPAQIASMRFADISCGSGSFLLGIYECLLRYHRDWYNANRDKAKPRRDVLENDDGTLRLSLSKKREILINNVYGVDIDHQAVEVAQLSLYLKLLDEETTASARQHQLELHEALLPSLSANIVCGNSLIGPEIAQADLFGDDEESDQLRRINPLDFATAFPIVMKEGGFDVIVGNPPYVNAWDFFANQPRVREFINANALYKTADRHWDLYILFIERAYQLTKKDGRFAYIIPYSYAIQKYGMASRQLLLRETVFESIADIRKVMVFGDVPVITIIPVCRKTTPRQTHRIKIIKPTEDSTKRKVQAFFTSHTVGQSALLRQHENMLRLDLSAAAEAFIAKIQARSISVGELCYVNYGAQMSSKMKGAFGKDHVIRPNKANEHCRPMISGRELYRYRIDWQGRYVDWSFAPLMYGPRWPEFFELPKVMIRDITGTHRIEATLDSRGYYCDHTILCALRKCDVAPWREQSEADIERSRKLSPHFLAGVIASKIVSAYFYLVLSGEGVRTGGGFHTYPETIRAFPIPDLDLAKRADKALHERISHLAATLLATYAKLHKAVTEKDRSFFERQAKQAENDLDNLLADFYALSADDREVVEKALA